MINVRINRGNGNIDVQGTLSQITVESLILVHWIYEAIRQQDRRELADLFAKKFLSEVKLALDPNFEELIRLSVKLKDVGVLKDVGEIVEMLKKWKEDSEA